MTLLHLPKVPPEKLALEPLAGISIHLGSGLAVLSASTPIQLQQMPPTLTMIPSSVKTLLLLVHLLSSCFQLLAVNAVVKLQIWLVGHWVITGSKTPSSCLQYEAYLGNCSCMLMPYPFIRPGTPARSFGLSSSSVPRESSISVSCGINGVLLCFSLLSDSQPAPIENYMM